MHPFQALLPVLKGCEGMSYAKQFYALAGKIRPA